MKRSRAADGGFSGLRAAAPYVRLFRGRVFVLKMGGEILRSSGRVDALMEQVGILNSLGVRLVLVHGGGPQSTELARRLGHEPRMVAGRRVTRSEDLRVAAQVLSGEINTTLLGACRKQGVHAVGVSGVDAGLVTATRRPPVHMEGEGPDPVDFGFVGDIESVDPSALHIMLEQGWVECCPSSARCPPTPRGTCSTSTPTRWPPRDPSRRPWRRPSSIFHHGGARHPAGS